MKIFGSEVCSVSWDVGSGWVGSHAWCDMEICSGKVQNRCVMKILVSEVLGLAHMRGVICSELLRQSSV